MKKQLWLVLALALVLVLACAGGAFAAYDAEAVTAEAVAEANSREALLAAHESTHLETVFSLWGPSLTYSTRDYVFYDTAGEVSLYDAAGGWNIYTDDSGRHVRYEWSAVEGATDGEWYLTADPILNSSTLHSFTLEGVRDNGNGTLTMTIAGEEGGFCELLESIDALEPDIPADARETIDIVLDAETLEIQSAEEYGVRTDGERMVVHRNVVTYDVPEPEAAAEIRAASAAFRAGAPADPRTITVVYYAGKSYEQTFTLTADRSFMVHPNTYWGYDLWYHDPERTQVFSSTDGDSDVTIYAFTPGFFNYDHDPRLNPRVLEDAVADSSAVYGFRPSETGSLKDYADADWTDPAVVAAGRLERIAYFESMRAMYDKLDEMRAAGEDIATIARTLSAMRNELRLAAYADDPEGLEAIKARNLEKYGHEEGPLADELYEKYGNWETVLVKAFSPNAGMDACLGLYDDCYDLYLAAGWIEEQSTALVQRQYAVAAFVDAFYPWVEETEMQLSDFADAGDLDASFLSEWEWAIAYGLVKGYEDDTLRPQQSIRRIEAVVLLSRCLPEVEATGEAIAFTDVPDWAKNDIDRLSAAGLLLGYGDGTLGAEDPMTVEQLYAILRRASA